MLAQQLLYGAWRNPTDSFPVSETFSPDERLALLGFGHVHAGIFLAFAAALFCFWLCTFSRIGIMSRAVAANPLAARAVGIPVGRIVLLMATLAGALSGLAGFTIVAGEEYKLTQFVGNDFIFPSIVVAYLARANPLGVIVAAIAIAALYTAGDSLKAFFQLPGATVLAIEAMLLFCVSCFEFLLRYRLSWVKDLMELLTAWLGTIPSFAAPFLLATIGLIINERAGVMNLGVEGIMAVAAVVAVIVNLSGGDPLLADPRRHRRRPGPHRLFAFMAVILRVDQVLAGLVTFALGIGVSGYLGDSFENQSITGISPLPAAWFACSAENPRRHSRPGPPHLFRLRRRHRHLVRHRAYRSRPAPARRRRGRPGRRCRRRLRAWSASAP